MVNFWKNFFPNRRFRNECVMRKYRKQQISKRRFDWSDCSDERLVDVIDAAEFIGMSAAYVKKWSGTRIPVFKIGAASRYKIGDLRSYLASCRHVDATD